MAEVKKAPAKKTTTTAKPAAAKAPAKKVESAKLKVETKKATGKTITITLIRSTNKATEVQKRTVEALGLKKIGQTRQMPDNDAARGQIFRVAHLLKIEENK